MQTRIHISQVGLGPEIPLGRRGCQIDDDHKRTGHYWLEDTYFHEPSKKHRSKNYLQLFRRHAEEFFIILKQVEFSKHPLRRENISNELQEALNVLLEIEIVKVNDSGELFFETPRGNYGPEFECVVQMVLETQLFIEAKRNVKVKYPYQDKPYDPDGQKYDILGGLDLSKL